MGDKPLIILAELNEGASNLENPNVPITPEAVANDAIAAARAGASIVHFHARDADGGQVADDLEFYAAAARAIRAEVDVLWFPPQPFAGRPETRWTHVAPLVEDPSTALETITIDPGSIDMEYYDPVTKTTRAVDMVTQLGASSEDAGPQLSHTEHAHWFCAESQRLGIKPIFGILEPGYLRRVLAYADMGLIDDPLAVTFAFTERFGFGLPPDPESLDTYVRMVPPTRPLEWFFSYFACSLQAEHRLREHAIRNGGHVRTGLGSPPLGGWPGDRPPTNEELVVEARDLAEKHDRPVATVAEARQLLGVTTTLASRANA